MLFKYPELLWALFLLLIPILIHLFQLRRFKKTPFTNVKILKKVVAESRKSNTLKKWLLLFTRLLILFALIVAFAQPFIPGKSALKSHETVIYLDNSMSMQANTGNGTTLQNMVQDIIRSVPEDNTFSLFTNDKTFKEVRIGEIKNDLLSLPYSNNQLQLEEINLKAKTLFTDMEAARKDLVLISDFQKSIYAPINDSLPNINIHLVQSVPDKLINIAIDTVFINNVSSDNIDLKTILSINTEIDNTPVSLYNGTKLIAKTSATFDENKKGEAIFTIPANTVIDGEILISDSGLNYDNQLFFNINEQEKIKVLSIDDTKNGFLNRIFTGDEFLFSSFTLNSLNYSQLDFQNLIILNEISAIPMALQNALKAYRNSGGNLVVIPSSQLDRDNYNTFLSSFSKTSLISSITEERKISEIAFSNPLFKNVFQNEVTNFQYPSVNTFYTINSNMPKILSYQSGDPFLVGEDGTYIFTASISQDNSNFMNSPLIVPTFYNMGKGSLRMPRIYEIIGRKTTVDIAVDLTKDKILKVSNEDDEFIPLQQSYSNKTTIVFDEYPVTAGIFQIKDKEKTIKNISFNFPREESQLSYLDLNQLHGNSLNNKVATLFQTIEKDNSINELWKWFAILALAFIFAEVLIQKFLK